MTKAKGAPIDTRSLAEGLKSLSYNLWWAWNPEAQDLIRWLSPLRWEVSNHNPIEVLQEVSRAELEARLHDEDFSKKVEQVLGEFSEYMRLQKTWAAEHAKHLHQPVAYFSAEFGLHECLRIYSGGLGVLAGDHIKSASDLGIPFVAVGLFYRHGYFQQRVDHNGWQVELEPVYDPEWLPMELVTQEGGGRLLNTVEIGHSSVYYQTWKVNVGRATLYLLDTSLPENDMHYQGLTNRVYGGDIDTRIGQEIVLGIGGVRLLRSLNIEPSVYHMNEGHSAFLLLELLREVLQSGKSFEEAKVSVMQRCIFTTHTPVPAGHDRFSSDLMGHSLGKFWGATGQSHETLMSLGRVHPEDSNEPFTMTVLALRLSRDANGVSKTHGTVSREMWKELYPGTQVAEVPIGSITNGVHTPSWATRRAHEFWNKRLGYDWTKRLMDPGYWEKIEIDGLASDEELWAFRCMLRRDLVEFARQRLKEQHYRAGGGGMTKFDRMLNPDALTICFARRFATYKRAPLIFRYPERVLPLFNDPARPIQMIFSGKAHPRDNEGKKFIQKISEMAGNPQLYGKVIFLENYDMNVARHLVAGADVWLNNPRRPLEASGTSGMKTTIHGCLNASILDGWWSEAFNGKNGWSIGDKHWVENIDEQDEADAQNLIAVVADKIIPEFFHRDAGGIPRRWIARMRHAMRTLLPEYNTNRMVAEYVKKYYVK